VPYKSRKNRRSISTRPTSDTGPAATATAAAEKTVAQASLVQPVKNTVVRSYSTKVTAAAVPVETHFLQELKWIGLVSVIIVILLIVAYYILR
jgi:hypothetical protein